MRVFLIVSSLFVVAFADVLIPDKWSQVHSPMESSKYQKIMKSFFPQNSLITKIFREGRIAGGSFAILGQFPYQALLLTTDQYGDSFVCGGAIISHNWILTAAHCLDDIVEVEVYVGIIDRRGSAVWGAVINDKANMIKHEAYDSKTVNNDIALIRLINTIVTNPNVREVSLPLRSHVGLLLDGKTVTVSGFGRYTDSSGPSQELRYVDGPIAPNAKCEASFGKINFRETNICLDTTGARSSCQGDSGGPMTIEINGKRHLVGIVSYGAAAGCTLNYPAVFTRVTSFLDWIQDKTKIVIS